MFVDILASARAKKPDVSHVETGIMAGKNLFIQFRLPKAFVYHCLFDSGIAVLETLCTACHFSKWVKSKNKSGNGFPGQRGLYRVQKYQLEKNWSGKF